MGLWNSPRSQLELTKSCGACTAHWLQSGQVLGLGFLRGHSAAPGVACEFAYCFACSDPQTSIWVGSSVAESAEFPGWDHCWHLSSPEGPALPTAPVPPCQPLPVPSLSALEVLRTKWLGLKSPLLFSTSLLIQRTEGSLEVTLTPVRLK